MEAWSQIFSKPGGELVLFLALLTLPIIPNLWAIYHAFYRVFPSNAERMIWICLAIFVPVLGGLLYLFIGRRRGRKPEWSK